MSRHKKNLYDILGVAKDASDDDIKKSFREKAKLFHPDTTTDEKDKKKMEEKFKEVSSAYEVLGDPQKRKEYDSPQVNNFNPFGGGNPFGFNNAFGGNPFDGINLSDILNNVHGFRFETNMRGGPSGFTRNIISHNITISLIKALSGGEIEIPVPSIGQNIKFDLPKPVKPGSNYTIRISGNSNNETLLSLTIDIEMPVLSDKQLKKIESALNPIVEEEKDKTS